MHGYALRGEVRNIVDASSQRDIRDASLYQQYALPKLFIKIQSALISVSAWLDATFPETLQLRRAGFAKHVFSWRTGIRRYPRSRVRRNAAVENQTTIACQISSSRIIPEQAQNFRAAE